MNHVTSRTLPLALALLAAGAAAQSLPPFTRLFERQRAPMGLSPFGLALGDVNGDGHVDAVVVGVNTLACLPGSADGVFGAVIPSPLPGTSLTRVWLADLDLDGDTDLVGSGSTKLVVALGDGAGAFSVLQTLPLSAAVQGALRDLTGDGAPDFAASNGAGIAFYVNAGNGMLAGPQLLSVILHGTASTATVAAADLDGDADLDLAFGVTPSAGTKGVGLMRGDGTGQFAMAEITPIALGSFTPRIALGDHEGDGDVDVFARTQTTDHENLFACLNDGAGLLAVQPAFTAGTMGGATGMATADLDDDGLLDVALQFPLTAGFDDFPLWIVRGGPGGTFAGASKLSTGKHLTDVACADLDGNGVADVATIDGDFTGSTASVATLLSDGAGGFLGPALHPTGYGRYGHPADLDGDGAVDVVFSTNSGLGVWMSGATGGAESWTSFSYGQSPDGLDLGDVDGDGQTDAVTCDLALGKVSLSLGDGAGGFAAPSTYEGLFSRDLAVGDLNGDGYADVLTAGTLPALTLLPGNPSGQLQPIKILPTFEGPTQVELADMNEDGDLDAVYGHCETVNGPGLAVLLGSGDYDFPTTVPAGGLVISVCYPNHAFTLGDLDADGHRDLVLVSGGGAFPYRGNGTGALVPVLPSPYWTTALGWTHTPSLADLDGDGHLDLLASEDGNADRAFKVLLGDGDGSFGAPIRFQSDDPIDWVGAVDVDGDQRLDAVAMRAPIDVGAGLPHLQVYTNIGAAPAWMNLGHALPGSFGTPALMGSGLPAAGETVHLAIDAMQPGAATLVIGLGVLAAPFKGGVLVPVPQILISGLPIDAQGFFELSAPWPASLPSGLQVAYQAWQSDAEGTKGFSSTNGLLSQTP